MALNLLDILLDKGAPMIILSEFVAEIIKELTSLRPECKIRMAALYQGSRFRFKSKKIRSRIRLYNSIVSFTSVNANIDKDLVKKTI